MSISPDDQKTADLTLQQLRGLRKENAAVLEQQVRIFEHLNRVQTTLLAFREETRDALREIRSDINALKSDVLLLDGHNASRHGEILNIVRRLDEGGVPPIP